MIEKGPRGALHLPGYREGCYSQRPSDCCLLCFCRVAGRSVARTIEDSERSDEETGPGASRSVTTAPDEACYVVIPAADVDVEEEDRKATVETTDGNEVELWAEEFDEIRLASAIHLQGRLGEESGE